MTALPDVRGGAADGTPHRPPPRDAASTGAGSTGAGSTGAGSTGAGSSGASPAAAIAAFPLDTEPPRHWFRLRMKRSRIWLLSTAVVLIFVAIMVPYRETVDEVHVVLPMLLMILLASSIGGERLGFFLAAVGFVAIDIIFQRPFGTFSLRKPHDLSVSAMFLSADIVVKAVMIALALASVASWTILFAKTFELRRRATSRRSRAGCWSAAAVRCCSRRCRRCDRPVRSASAPGSLARR